LVTAKPRIWLNRGFWYCQEELYCYDNPCGMALTPWDAYASWHRQLDKKVVQKTVKTAHKRRLPFVPNRSP